VRFLGCTIKFFTKKKSHGGVTVQRFKNIFKHIMFYIIYRINTEFRYQRVTISFTLHCPIWVDPIAVQGTCNDLLEVTKGLDARQNMLESRGNYVRPNLKIPRSDPGLQGFRVQGLQGYASRCVSRRQTTASIILLASTFPQFFALRFLGEGVISGINSGKMTD